jgi:hypothetical protein
LSDLTFWQLLDLEPQEGSGLVFIYDLLLDRPTLRSVCPSAAMAAIARLPAVRLVANSEGTITAVPARESGIHGIVVEIGRTDQAALAAYVRGKGLTDTQAGVALDRYGNGYPVAYYASKNRRFGHARSLEIVRLLALATEFRFPRQFMDEIAAWADRPERS